MEIPPKPKFPQEIYEDGILLYTICDWFYVAPGSKESKILKTGWLPSKKVNYSHPRMKKRISRNNTSIRTVLKKCRSRFELVKQFLYHHLTKTMNISWSFSLDLHKNESRV